MPHSEYKGFLFPTGLDFVKGGKSPGMYGGYHRSGETLKANLFSTRFMFRTKWNG
jgi:hypothetical protein